MNESGVMNFFTQVMVRHGVVVAMLAVVLVVVLLLTAYYVKNQIDAAKLKAATEAAAVAAREAELRQADAVEADVVRKVRAEVFWPPTSPPPAGFEEFAAICHDDQFAAALAAEEGGNGT